MEFTRIEISYGLIIVGVFTAGIGIGLLIASHLIRRAKDRMQSYI